MRNHFELAALASLLATQLVGILIWYKQQPGRTEGAAWYRLAAIVFLFAVNFCVIAGFVVVTAWYYLKQKSKTIVMWLPCLHAAFASLMWFEEKTMWVCGDDPSPAQQVSRREEWSFYVSQREGRLFTQGQAFAIRTKYARIAQRVAALGSALADRLHSYRDEDRRGPTVPGTVSDARDRSSRAAETALRDGAISAPLLARALVRGRSIDSGGGDSAGGDGGAAAAAPALRAPRSIEPLPSDIRSARNVALSGEGGAPDSAAAARSVSAARGGARRSRTSAIGLRAVGRRAATPQRGRTVSMEMSAVSFAPRPVERSDSRRVLNPLVSQLRDARAQRSAEALVLPEGEIMSI